MKPLLKISSWIVSCLAVAGLALTLNLEVAMAAEIDAALNVMGYDREVAVTINGVRISKISGGKSHSVRLFVAGDPRIKTLPPEMQKSMQEQFCLKEGENTIEISFREKGQPSSPSRFTVSLEADNYPAPVLEYARNPEVKEGHAKGMFALYPTAPSGFKTVILE